MKRLVLILALAACKQGEGEPCQIDRDCESGLVCSTVTNTCVRSDDDIGPTIDAPEADAEVPDAPPVDGGVDAMPAACANGLDDDEDGNIDYPADLQCLSPTDTDEAT